MGSFPWDYFARIYGPEKAEAQIHVLANKAAADGHEVRWLRGGFESSGRRAEILRIDGHTDTGYVARALNKYR